MKLFLLYRHRPQPLNPLQSLYQRNQYLLALDLKNFVKKRLNQLPVMEMIKEN